VNRPLPPNHAALIALPLLNAREAEVLIDLLGQIQGALWDTYGDAILGQVTDEEPSTADAPNPTSDDGDDSSPF
jgi:hypothetical protein